MEVYLYLDVNWREANLTPDAGRTRTMKEQESIGISEAPIANRPLTLILGTCCDIPQRTVAVTFTVVQSSQITRHYSIGPHFYQSAFYTYKGAAQCCLQEKRPI